MRFIDTNTHGYLDYIVGIFFIVCPWIFNLKPGEPQGILFIILGVAAIAYSLLTKYELGLLRVLPMKVHLALDLLSGIVLASSPWLFGFAEEVYLPHVILGIFEIGASLMTKVAPAHNMDSSNNFG